MANGMWIFLAVGAVALFGIFLPTATWMEHRRKEREAFYKAEPFRRIAEAPVKAAMPRSNCCESRSASATIKSARRHENRRHHQHGRGHRRHHLSLSPCFTAEARSILCGLIPALVGAAMMVYVYVLAEPSF